MWTALVSPLLLQLKAHSYTTCTLPPLPYPTLSPLTPLLTSTLTLQSRPSPLPLSPHTHLSSLTLTSHPHLSSLTLTSHLSHSHSHLLLTLTSHPHLSSLTLISHPSHLSPSPLIPHTPTHTSYCSPSPSHPHPPLPSWGSSCRGTHSCTCCLRRSKSRSPASLLPRWTGSAHGQSASGEDASVSCGPRPRVGRSGGEGQKGRGRGGEGRAQAVRVGARQDLCSY